MKKDKLFTLHGDKNFKNTIHIKSTEHNNRDTHIYN